MREFLEFHRKQTLAMAIELERRGLFDDALELRSAAWQLWCRIEAL